MISTQISILLVGIIVGAISMSNADKEMKCEPSERQIQIVAECFKEVTDKELKGEEDFKNLDENAEEKITMCAFKKEGIIDDKGFNLDKAEASVKDLKASQDIKNKLVENLKKCESERGKDKVEEMLECLKEGEAVRMDDELSITFAEVQWISKTYGDSFSECRRTTIA